MAKNSLSYLVVVASPGQEIAEKSKTEIARNMLSMGMDLKVISSATGLSSQEVKRLAH